MNIIDFSKKAFEFFILITGIILIIWRVINRSNTDDTNAFAIVGITLISSWMMLIAIPKYLAHNYSVPESEPIKYRRTDSFHENYQKEYYVH